MTEYGKENETWSSSTSTSSCKASWKANGLTCIGNTLYMTVSRHAYAKGYFGNENNPACNFLWQRAMDGSIISSNDSGLTWSKTPFLDANHPTVQFPGFSFGTPAFIQYGKGMNTDLADGADLYVYAISNDGYWANGNKIYLARARRSTDIKNRLNWEYLTSNASPEWGQIEKAVPILENQGHFGVSQAQYIPPSNGAPGVYILPQWYFPIDMHTTVWTFYTSPKPWGPWIKMAIGTDGDGMEKAWPAANGEERGYYNPTIVQKWIGECNPETGTRDLWIIFAGYPGTPNPNPSSYRLQRMRMILSYRSPWPKPDPPG
jgi:hypothetical protein